MKKRKLLYTISAFIFALVLCFTAVGAGCNNPNDGDDNSNDAASATVSAMQPLVPAAFIDGFEYDVPDAVFLDADGNVLEYSVYLIDEDGKESLLNQKTFTPSVYVHGKNISLKYVIREHNGERTLNYSVPVLKAASTVNGKTSYQFDKMFVTENVESSDITESGTVFYGSRDFSITYANALEASFSLNLKSVEGYTNFGSTVIKVADARNPEISISLSVTPVSDTQSSLSLNGGAPVTVTGNITDTADGLKFSFNNRNFQLFDGLNAVATTVAFSENGDEFNGFTSGLVNISVGVVAPRAVSAISVVNINNQAMTSASTEDRIAPFAVCGEDIVIINNLKDKVVIPKALAFDVLDPNAKTTVSVFAPDGETAKTADGEELYELDASSEHVFVADLLGEYSIQYSATDRNGNRYGNGWYSVFIVDSVAPTLKVVSPVSDTVSVGAEITVSNLDYSDDCSAKEDITVLITVILYNGDYRVVNSGDKFKFEKAGIYYFHYTVIDEYYNMTTVFQTIVCK